MNTITKDKRRGQWLWPGALWLLLLLYLLGSGLFLTRYPYVHSDEAWLSGLSREIHDSGSYASTERFFDLKERNPHAIKILFHSLQVLAIQLGGYGIATFRLLSLLAAGPALVFFYLTARRLFAGRWAALLAAGLLALDLQFLYASHMARQEIFILLALLICLYLLIEPQPLTNRRVVLLGLVSGLAAGFHPNAFILACLCGLALLARLPYRNVRVRQIGLYVLVCGAAAGLFVLLSLWLDPQFISHYAAYGRSEFELTGSLAMRTGEWLRFGSKLFAGVSGTYYLPDLRLQLMLFPLLGLLLACYTLAMRREQPEETAKAATLLAAALGVCAGIFLIGRYNQLSIVFLIPLGWLIVLQALSLFGPRLFYGLGLVLVALLIVIGVREVKPWLAYDYDDYLAQLSVYLPADEPTLGNLNSEYHFENGALYDYRNLAYLRQHELTLADYIARNGIRYIVYTAELDYIEAHRPYWNIIYGAIDWAELRAYLRDECELLGSFMNPVYGMRIIDILGDPAYAEVSVYRVK